MATGDKTDMRNRLFATLPPWFPDVPPLLDAALDGIAATLAFLYSLYQFAALQTRINTATGGWLDLIAWDFFKTRFLRRYQETDANFRPRILQEVLRPRQTRAALTQLVTDLTGTAPTLFEPWNAGDCGCLDVGTAALDVGLPMGSTDIKNQVFVTVYRTPDQGIANICGLDGGLGGLDVGALAPADMGQVTGPLLDSEIYERIAQTIGAGNTAWVALAL